jgi:hypothetical protein
MGCDDDFAVVVDCFDNFSVSDTDDVFVEVGWLRESLLLLVNVVVLVTIFDGITLVPRHPAGSLVIKCDKSMGVVVNVVVRVCVTLQLSSPTKCGLW